MYSNKEQPQTHTSSENNVPDMGSWNDVFPRANWIVDINPYETGHNNSELFEQFDKWPWVEGDINDPRVWERFSDKEFNFVICSHILEDIRGPLFVRRQLIRVAKRGYVDVPTHFRECTRASADDNVSGYDHHRWLVEVVDGALIFAPKLHWAHVLDFLTNARRQYLSNHKFHYVSFFWKEHFSYREHCPKGGLLEAASIMYLFDLKDVTQFDEHFEINANLQHTDDTTGRMLWTDRLDWAIERAGAEVVQRYVEANKSWRSSHIRKTSILIERLEAERSRENALEQRMEEVLQSNVVTHQEMVTVYGSKSWRVTGPLRALARRIHQFRADGVRRDPTGSFEKDDR